MPKRAVIIFITTLLASCTPPASARFEVSGVAAEYSECFEVAFPFVPIFHAYRERAGSVGLFMQSRGGNFQFVDAVYFEIFDPENLNSGETVQIDPVATPDTRVVANLDLGESCPDVGVLAQTPSSTPSISEVPLIQGTVTFNQFSREVDGIIDGTVDGMLVHPRSGEVVAESFTGDFNFTVQVGQPYEEFRN